MAKKGSTRPWRVRYAWANGVKGTTTHASYEDARAFVGELEGNAEQTRQRVTGSITHRDGMFRVHVGGRMVESVTFEYGPETPGEPKPEPYVVTERVEPDVDASAPVVRATDDPVYDEAAQQDAEGFSCLVELLAGTDHGTGYYRPGTVEPLDAAETAYDGSAAPQVRELTARERDVLCRLLTQALHDPRFRDEQTYTFAVIRQVLDPRR